MQDLAGLAPDGLDDRGVGVTGRADRDARVEVEKNVAVDVLDAAPRPR